MRDSNRATVFFENSQPILRVENMEASLRFYVDLLGFKNAPWGTAGLTSVSRDRAGIYLRQRDQGQGRAWLWIGVEDVEKLYVEYKAHGVTIRFSPTNHPWALEMQIEDPDGNVLRFGSEPKGAAEVKAVPS
jgi:catechol 2,3-dioxygenase-like lactoylglutathione lyase family enzyme